MPERDAILQLKIDPRTYLHTDKLAQIFPPGALSCLAQLQIYEFYSCDSFTVLFKSDQAAPNFRL